MFGISTLLVGVCVGFALAVCLLILADELSAKVRGYFDL